MQFAAVYGLLVGILMIAQWGFFIRAGQVPELKTEPVRIGFHLAAEFITAVCLIVAGVGLLTAVSWAPTLYLVAIGMLLYTIIQSPGYFAQQQQWPMVLMFAVLLAAGLASLILIL